MYKVQHLPNNIYIIFILANIFSFIKIFYYDLKAGMIISLILSGLLIINLKYYKINKLNFLFFIYFSFEMISFLNYLFVPVSRNFAYQNPQIISQSISFILIPQLYFFVSGNYIGKNPDLINSNFKNLIYINFILIITGILFYFFRPNYFLVFQRKLFPLQFDLYNGYFPRLTSYMSSLVVGVICSTSFILTIEYIKNRWIKIILLCSFAAGSLLSMERGSWVMITFGTFLYFIGKIYFNKKSIKRPKIKIRSIKYLIFFVLIFCTLFISVSNNLTYSKFYIEFENKTLNFFNAIAERNSTWKSATDLSFKYPFGLGMGLLSHKGVQNKFSYSVPDGNYFRILGENGYLGLIAFIILLFEGLYILFKKEHLSLMIALFIFSVQAIGTNVFDLYYISFVFWFILGIAYSLKKIEYEEE